jgi:hypothetical protein
LSLTPVPDAATRLRIEKEVRELFKADYGRRDPAGRKALAEKLLAQAAAAQIRAEERYVLLCEARDAALSARSAELALEIPELQKEKKSATEAELLLAVKQDDPAANLALGRYLCFVKDDWKRGAEFLRKAADPALRDLAAKELAGAKEPEAQAALGDAWDAAAERERVPLQKRRCRGRAAHWYRLALEEATGLLKARVEARLEKLGGASGTLELLSWIRPPQHAVEGTWKFEEKVLVSPDRDEARILVPYQPPAEYDLRVVASRQDGKNEFVVGLVAGGRQVMVMLNPDGDSGLERVDGERAGKNVTAVKERLFADDKPHTILCSVRRGRVRVSVDGKKLVDFEGQETRFSIDSKWRVPDELALFLGADGAVYRVHGLSMVAVSGVGRKK